MKFCSTHFFWFTGDVQKKLHITRQGILLCGTIPIVCHEWPSVTFECRLSAVSIRRRCDAFFLVGCSFVFIVAPGRLTELTISKPSANRASAAAARVMRYWCWQGVEGICEDAVLQFLLLWQQQSWMEAAEWWGKALFVRLKGDRGDRDWPIVMVIVVCLGCMVSTRKLSNKV